MTLDEFRSAVRFIELGSNDEEIVIDLNGMLVDIVDVDRTGDGPLRIIAKTRNPNDT